MGAAEAFELENGPSTYDFFPVLDKTEKRLGRLNLGWF
jgi:hypothetical protein